MATGRTSAMMALRDPDVGLMLRVRADDHAAFSELVTRYQNRLVAVMAHLTGRPDEAEDLAQEVFLRVYRTRTKYTPKSKFNTWLYTIANNLAMNSLRDRKNKRQVPLEISNSSGSWRSDRLADGREAAPTAGIQHRELADVIRSAMDELNERQRTAVVLNKFEEMNYREIAEVMGLTEKAVKSLLSRARDTLRQRLEPYLRAGGELPPVQENE